MKHVVCYSGGETSARVAVAVVERFGREDVVLLNHDINPDKEHADIKRFKREVAEYLGLPVTYANIGGIQSADEIPDQFDVCITAKAFKVGVGTELCTNRLKTAPFLAWLALNVPDKSCVCYYGFEPTETTRIERRRRILGEIGYSTSFPLADWTEGVLQGIEEIGIARPSTYTTWKHGNCVGCLKAGKQHWYVVFCLRRDIWEKGKFAEGVIGYSIHSKATLESWETDFEAMVAAGVEPTEQIPSGQFWATAKKMVANLTAPKPHGVMCF